MFLFILLNATLRGGINMVSMGKILVSQCLMLLLVMGCASVGTKPNISKESVKPGGVVYRGNKQFKLLGQPISPGDPISSVLLVDSKSMQEVDLSKEKGKVLFISIVPSIDTTVCEAQTHYLSEKGDKLPSDVQRISVSRDIPFAQTRFAREAKLMDIRYLSDYKEGEFGHSMGLLMDGIKLLARSVVLVDKKGMVRYLQIVPEMTHLPDMEKAFEVATQLAGE
jgi:thiol peroxidase